ncbi:MAG: YraN family protein [Lachnospiraceae bacterium]|nr:YraN family protein [Lachnospiraceae bacterium]
MSGNIRVNYRRLGENKEHKAESFLKAKGVRIIARNFRSRNGEIDLIGYDGEYLVFFEVKYRGGCTAGSSLEAVDFRKQMRICKTSDYFRAVRKIDINQSIRYDVIGIDNENISWIKNAFEYHG